MIKRFLVAAALVLSPFAVQAEIINIDNAEVVRLMATGVPVVDIRTEGEWKDGGVIAGSQRLTFVDESGRSNPPQWLEKLKAVTKSGEPVILVCRSGRRSSAAAQFLSDQAGYKTVYNVSKGMNAWVGEGRPVVPIKSPE